MAFAGGKRPFIPKKRRSPPRDVADLTCPNCNKKGHTRQDCTKPKIELTKRKCFICNMPGCMAKTCPKRKAMAKTLTGGTGSAGGTDNAWFGCVASSCAEPSHRDKNRRRMQSWQAATEAAARMPRGITLGDAMGSVFAQLARLEAVEEFNKLVSQADSEVKPRSTGAADRAKSRGQGEDKENQNGLRSNAPHGCPTCVALKCTPRYKL